MIFKRHLQKLGKSHYPKEHQQETTSDILRVSFFSADMNRSRLAGNVWPSLELLVEKIVSRHENANKKRKVFFDLDIENVKVLAENIPKCFLM